MSIKTAETRRRGTARWPRSEDATKRSEAGETMGIEGVRRGRGAVARVSIGTGSGHIDTGIESVIKVRAGTTTAEILMVSPRSGATRLTIENAGSFAIRYLNQCIAAVIGRAGRRVLQVARAARVTDTGTTESRDILGMVVTVARTITTTGKERHVLRIRVL